MLRTTSTTFSFAQDNGKDKQGRWRRKQMAADELTGGGEVTFVLTFVEARYYMGM